MKIKERLIATQHIFMVGLIRQMIIFCGLDKELKAAKMQVRYWKRECNRTALLGAKACRYADQVKKENDLLLRFEAKDKEQE